MHACMIITPAGRGAQRTLPEERRAVAAVGELATQASIATARRGSWTPQTHRQRVEAAGSAAHATGTAAVRLQRRGQGCRMVEGRSSGEAAAVMVVVVAAAAAAAGAVAREAAAGGSGLCLPAPTGTAATAAAARAPRKAAGCGDGCGGGGRRQQRHSPPTVLLQKRRVRRKQQQPAGGMPRGVAASTHARKSRRGRAKRGPGFGRRLGHCGGGHLCAVAAAGGCSPDRRRKLQQLRR